MAEDKEKRESFSYKILSRIAGCFVFFCVGWTLICIIGAVLALSSCHAQGQVATPTCDHPITCTPIPTAGPSNTPCQSWWCLTATASPVTPLPTPNYTDTPEPTPVDTETVGPSPTEGPSTSTPNPTVTATPTFEGWPTERMGGPLSPFLTPTITPGADTRYYNLWYQRMQDMFQPWIQGGINQKMPNVLGKNNPGSWGQQERINFSFRMPDALGGKDLQWLIDLDDPVGDSSIASGVSTFRSLFRMLLAVLLWIWFAVVMIRLWSRA